MKKKCLKKVVALFAVALFVFSTSSAYAVSLDSDEILLSNGFISTELTLLSEEQKQELVYNLQHNPQSVQSDTVIVEIDELKIMRDFANSSDEELLNIGYTQTEIEVNRALFASYMTMTVEELSEKLGICIDWANTIQSTLAGSEIQPYAGISENKLKIHMSRLTHSSSSYAVQYTILAGFEWLQQPQVYKTDQFAFAWGGEADSRYATSVIEYTSRKGETFSKSAEITKTPNAGIIYTWEWCQANTAIGTGYADKGAVNFDLVKNTFDNYATSITAVYGHKTLNVSGGISITPAAPHVLPTFNFPSGYDYSKQLYVDLTM